MDWKKEYRVSDLFGRKPKVEQQPPVEPTPEPPSAPASEPVAPPETVPAAEVEALPVHQAPAPVEEAPAFVVPSGPAGFEPFEPVETEAPEVAAVEPEPVASEPVEPVASEEPAVEVAASEPSVWKKEIRVSSLFRRGEREEPAPGFWIESPSEAPAEPPLEPAPETVAAAEPLRPELTEPEAPSVPAPEPSVWKKEIRVSSLFRRGEKDEPEPVVPPEAVPVAEIEAPPALQAPAPVEEAPAGVAPSEPAGSGLSGPVEFQPFQPEAVEPGPFERAAPEPFERVEPAPAESEPVEPAASGESAVEAAAPEPSLWKKEIRVSSLFRNEKKKAPEPAAPPEAAPVAEVEPPPVLEPPAAVEETPVAAVEPQPFQPEAVEPGPFERSALGWFEPVEPTHEAFEPEAFVAAPVEPEPVAPEPVAHAANEEPAAEAAVPEPSVWKKEIRVSSLFRKEKREAPEPAAPAAEVQPPPARVEEAPADVAPSEALEETPVEPQPVEPEPVEPASSEEPAADEAPPTSVWKKEIRLGPRRGPKQPRAGGREKPGRREQPAQRERPAETRAARSEARGPRIAAQLPDVPLVRSINLLPRDEPKARAGRPSLVQVGVALLGVLALGGVSFAFIYERSRVADRRGAVEDLQAQVAAIEIPDQAATPDQGAQLAGEALARAGALSTALDERIVWDRLLRQLSLVLPEDVWFETVQTTAPGTTTDPATGLTVPSTGAPTVTITGYAKTQEGLAQLVGRLGVVPQLGTVQLQSGTTIELGDEKVVQFTLAATLEQGGGAAS